MEIFNQENDSDGELICPFPWSSHNIHDMLTTLIVPLRKAQVYLRIFSKCLSLITPPVGWLQDVNILRVWSSSNID
jgi:hypothetical protein